MGMVLGKLFGAIGALVLFLLGLGYFEHGEELIGLLFLGTAAFLCYIVVRSSQEESMTTNTSTSQPGTQQQTSQPGGDDLYFRTLLWELRGAFVRFGAAFWYGLRYALIATFILFWLGQIRYQFNFNFQTGVDSRFIGYGFLWLIFGTLLVWSLIRGFSPIVVSLATWIGEEPFFDETPVQLGARHALRNIPEQQRVNAAFGQLLETGAGRIPSQINYMVIDSSHPNSYTIGKTMYFTTAAVEHPHFIGLLAHELGHLMQGDGVRLQALRHFVMNAGYTMGVDRQLKPMGSMGGGQGPVRVQTEDEQLYFHMQASLIREDMAKKFGGYGLMRLWAYWADFWRDRDFKADDFARSLGVGDNLRVMLEDNDLVDVAQPFYLSARPYNKQRIDRLMAPVPDLIPPVLPSRYAPSAETGV
jgi:Zn-dependent protease with chaperone function